MYDVVTLEPPGHAPSNRTPAQHGGCCFSASSSQTSAPVARRCRGRGRWCYGGQIHIVSHFWEAVSCCWHCGRSDAVRESVPGAPCVRRVAEVASPASRQVEVPAGRSGSSKRSGSSGGVLCQLFLAGRSPRQFVLRSSFTAARRSVCSWFVWSLCERLREPRPSSLAVVPPPLPHVDLARRVAPLS